MYRFLLRPKWLLLHVVVLCSVVGMLFLARWQWDKHIARDAFVENVKGRLAAEPKELAPLLDPGTPAADIEWYVVTASGSYLTAGELRQLNRTQNGFNGINILTPFQISNGPIIIVNRGFVPDGIKVPAAPTGTIVVGGTARTSQVRKTGELTDDQSASNNEVRRVDLAFIAEHIDQTIAPIYVDLIATKPASPSPPVPVPPPNLGSGPPHVSYTGQWLFFSLCAIAGWVFAVRRSAKSARQALAQDATDEPLTLPSA
jgi:cytochrome oxidase assembly protein ShyY1